MKVLITGADGFIGSHLTAALSKAGHEVVGLVRNPKQARRQYPGRRFAVCDFARDHADADWRPRLDGMDLVINAVGIIRESGCNRFEALHTKAPSALFRAAAQAGVQKVVQISALGADGGAEEGAASAYHRTKRAADDVLAGLNVNWVCLRPSVVMGLGAKSTALFQALAALPFVPLVGGGGQKLQPLQIEDLTRLVLLAVETDRLDRRCVDVVGPRAYRVRDLLEHLRTWQGKGPLRRFVLPEPVALALARLSGPLGFEALAPEAIRMLRRDNIGDAEALTRLCGFQPKSLEAALAETPARQSDRLAAGLYWLAPVVRLCLAFLWLFTAAVSAFVFPVEESYALLGQIGIPLTLAPLFLFGAAGLNAVLGLALLFRKQVTCVGWIQIALMTGYCLLFAIALPEFWLHPFMPVGKNLPIIAATLVMIQLEAAA